ncbi:MAG TPA: NEW3 domain-containing protein [Acidimicrobiia bacterium]
MRKIRTVLAALVLAALLPAPAIAQEGGLALTTPYLGVAVEPGQTATFDFNVVAPEGTEVDLAVTDVPEGWSATIEGGGFVVDRVLVGEGLEHRLQLKVDVPQDAGTGTYEIGLQGTSSAGTDTLEFALTVAEEVGGGVSLTAEFPVLSDAPDVTFSFTLELENDTTDEIQFGLQAEGPEGWQISARPSGQTRASTVTVAAGSSERITVEVDPPDFTSAGEYPIVVRAAGGGQTAEAELTVEITGTYELTLLTPDESLNVTVQAGRPTEMPLILVNDGSAPLTEVSLSATPPRDWEVTFSPETVETIEPGATQQVIATITPAGNAITGDYRITFRARVPQGEDEIEVRATVETSAFWGFVGVAIIVIALAALGMVFRRFGRR